MHRLFTPFGVDLSSGQTCPDRRHAANVRRSLQPPDLVVEAGQFVPALLQRPLGGGQVALQAGHQAAPVLYACRHPLPNEPDLANVVRAQPRQGESLRLLLLKDPVGGVRDLEAFVQRLAECDQVIERLGELHRALRG